MVLPDALKLEPFAKTGTMKIQTTVLEPQIAANNFVRYVLEKRAILGSDSIFTFGLNINALGAGLVPTMPINTGISCLIKNCTLRLGNVIISRTQDWAHYDTMARCFRASERRTLQETVTGGILDTMRPSTKTDGEFSLHNAVYTSDTACETPYQLNLVNEPVFSIKLSDLFPALQGMQIPLGHLEDNMVVEFELHKQGPGQHGILAKMNTETADDAAYEVTPNYNEMTMLADYLSFSEVTHEEMDDMINGGDGQIMPFYEIVTIMSSQESVGGPKTTQVTQELGLAGRTVRSIAVGDTTAACALDTVAGQKNFPQGVFSFNRLIDHSGNAVVEETQLKVNDMNVYPRPVKSVTHMVNELESVFTTGPLRITRPEYVGNEASEGIVDQNVKFNGTESDNLAGKRYMTGVPLLTDPTTLRGTAVVDKPIRYERSMQHADTLPAFTSRYFCAVEKAFQMKDGMVSVMV